ncbi:MAG: hypothetical protein C4321_05090, partial [Chloroflexota bacterium]
MYKALANIGLTTTGPEFRAGDEVPADYPHLKALLEWGFVERVDQSNPANEQADQGNPVEAGGEQSDP